MINSEKELEDYICNNQESFIERLKEATFTRREDVKYLGRQIQIGNQNIADLMYYYDKKITDIIPDEDIKTRNYIIVELKNRPLETKDLGQIGRYITTLYDKLQQENLLTGFEEIKGVLLGRNLDDNMQEVEMLLSIQKSEIYFMNIKTNIDFEAISYSHNEDYINNLKLDNRIQKYYNENKNVEE